MLPSQASPVDREGDGLHVGGQVNPGKIIAAGGIERLVRIPHLPVQRFLLLGDRLGLVAIELHDDLDTAPAIVPGLRVIVQSPALRIISGRARKLVLCYGDENRLLLLDCCSRRT